eukprot:9005367-Prorocentrum_lima.AAC.1
MVDWRKDHVLHLLLDVVNANMDYLNQRLIEVSCRVDLVQMQIVQGHCDRSVVVSGDVDCLSLLWSV